MALECSRSTKCAEKLLHTKENMVVLVGFESSEMLLD